MTTEDLQNLFAQGFLDTRLQTTRPRPHVNEPAYKLGGDIARVHLKINELDALLIFRSFLAAKIEVPNDEQTGVPDAPQTR